MTAVKKIPEGYHTVTPYFCAKPAAQAIEFYQRAFGAELLMSMPMPDGRIGHAELRFGDSIMMMADEFPDRGFLSPATLGGTPCGFMLCVEDCDALFARAVAAGATVKEPISDKFYGDRAGTVTDPFGHSWTVSTHVRDVSPEDMEKAAASAHGAS